MQLHNVISHIVCLHGPDDFAFHEFDGLWTGGSAVKKSYQARLKLAAIRNLKSSVDDGCDPQKTSLEEGKHAGGRIFRQFHRRLSEGGKMARFKISSI